MDQNSATDRAFHASLSPLPLSSPSSTSPLRSSLPLPPLPPPPISYAHITPSPGNPVPMEIDAARRAKAIVDTCHCCGDTGHWAKDCPTRFEVRCLSIEELQAALDDKLDAELGDNPEDTKEPQSDHDTPPHLNIRALEVSSHPLPSAYPSASSETQASSRHLPKEGVIVRGSSPLPSSCPHSTSHAPIIRPMEPPYIPPNIRAAIDSHR